LLGLSARGPLEESAHLGLGQIRLAEDARQTAPASAESLEHRHDQVMSWLAAFARDSAAAFEELDKALWELLEAAARGDRDYLLHTSLDNDEQRLFRHSIQVCLLATEIARALGIRGTALHEISLSSLLHDIGYLDLPAQLVWRKRSLGPAEEQVVRRHTMLGAARLAAVDAMPPLCVIAAYEHHLGWDGSGYPERAAAAGRRPHLVARIVAVADHWEALRNLGARWPEEQRNRLALRGLEAQAGLRLDPELVKILTRGVIDWTARPGSSGDTQT
jgi:HD-GYP domain-containing protein (c-di-GMP phosphodiesterase class II)